jgi:hypothetical protein
MTTVAFEDFLPQVAPLVLMCPNPMVVNAIRNTAIDFCTRTNVWQETQDTESATAIGLPLDLSAPVGAMVVLVLACKIDGQLIPPVTIDYLDDRHPNWEVATGTPSNYFQPNTAQLGLYPKPVAAVNVTLRVAYAPTRASTGIDSAIYENNLTTIAAGALASLLVMPGVAWSNPELALYYAAIYAAGTTEALASTQKSFTRARNRVRSNPF